MDKKISIKAIGLIHSQIKSRSDAPRQGVNIVSKIEIFEKYNEGLKDIEGFSHLHIFYWFHKSTAFNLLVKTPWDEELHGVFCTRSPNHPNPLAYAVVELIKRENNFLTVKGLDAIDGTPVLDIKPYIKEIDCKPEAFSGWAEDKKFKF